MAEGKLHLRTFLVSVEGKQQKIKGISAQSVIKQYVDMGIEASEVRIINELSTGDNPTPPQEQANESMQLLSVDDLHPDMQQQVRSELEQIKRDPVSNVVPEHVTNHTQSSTKTDTYWSDGKTDYMLCDGLLYKKSWKKTSISALEKNHNIRLRISNDDGKVPARIYTVELMDWIPIEQK